METRTTQLTILTALCFFSTFPSHAAVIDFEQIAGVTPYESMGISNQFKPFFGITFRREDNQATRWPVIARVGAPQAAFDRNGNVSADTIGGTNEVVFGQFFLTDTANSGGGSSKLILDFAAPVSEASGYILDIDGGERVTVAAYPDATGTNALDNLVFTNSPPVSGDGIATFWSFTRSTKDILRIEIDGHAAPLGYDLFSSDYAPTNQTPASLDVRMYPGLFIAGDIGRPYRIQYANRLGGTGWVTLTNIFLPASPYLFLDVTATNAAVRFYRTQSGE